MKYQLASVCVAVALFLDAASYWRQIRKIIRTKKSTQVSAMSFVFKIAKGVFAATALCIFLNFVGLGMEAFMVLVYGYSLYVVIKYKPRGWSLWK